MRDDRPTTVSFPLRAWLILGLFAVLQVGALILNNVQIGAQLAVVEQQRDFQAKNDPLVRDLRPIADDAARRLEETRSAQRDASRLVRESRPLVADLRDAEVDEVLPTVGALAEGLATRNRLVRLVEGSSRLVGEFEQTNVLRSIARLVAEIERTRLIERTPRLAEDTNRLVRRQLTVQLETLAVQKELLAIQKEALVRIRSIDNKTGGPAPGAAPVR